MMGELSPILLSAPRRKQISTPRNRLETRQVRSRAGTINYLGVSVSLMSAYVSSCMQLLIPSVTIRGIREVNGLLRDLKRREHSLKYIQPSKEEHSRARVVVFSDAGFPHGGPVKPPILY